MINNQEVAMLLIPERQIIAELNLFQKFILDPSCNSMQLSD